MTDEKTFRKTVPAATEVASAATAIEPSTVDFAMLERAISSRPYCRPR